MPQFKNTKDLINYLKNAVDKSLTTDVFPVVKQEEIDSINSTVYSQKTSGQYQRRGNNGGIGDANNIVINGGAANNGILSVTNITKPNPYLNGVNGQKATINKNLPYVIESGKGYDYWQGKARPFTEKTIENLKEKQSCTAALKKGLIKQGISVK